MSTLDLFYNCPQCGEDAWAICQCRPRVVIDDMAWWDKKSVRRREDGKWEPCRTEDAEGEVLPELSNLPHPWAYVLRKETA